MAKFEFESESDYKEYLKSEFEKIERIGEFNIFLHCVTTHSSYYGARIEDKESEIKQKVKGILENGLDLDGSNFYGKYGSIRCTAKFVDIANANMDLSKILQYDYLSHTRYVHTIILLIPKYIKVDGNVINFSSIDFELTKGSQHSKACLFDAVKDTHCPPEFTFGYQVFDSANQTFKFYKNENHFACLEQDKKEDLGEYFSKKIQRVFTHCKEKYGVEKLKDVLRKMTDEHMLAINDYLIDP